MWGRSHGLPPPSQLCAPRSPALTAHVLPAGPVHRQHLQRVEDGAVRAHRAGVSAWGRSAARLEHLRAQRWVRAPPALRVPPPPAAPRPTLWAQLPFTSRSSAAALRPPGCNWPTAPPRVSSARGRRGAVRASPAPQCAPVRGGTRPHPPRLPKGTGGKASRGGGADLQHRQLPRVVPIPLEGHGGPQRCSAVAMGSARRPLPGPPSRRASRGREDQWGARRRGAARHDGSCSSPSHFRSGTRRPRDYDSQRPPRRALAGPGSSGAPRYGGGSGAPSGARGHFAGTGAALRSDGERREGRRAEPTAGTAPSQPRPHRVPCRPWSCPVPIPSPSPSSHSLSAIPSHIRPVPSHPRSRPDAFPIPVPIPSLIPPPRPHLCPTDGADQTRQPPLHIGHHFPEAHPPHPPPGVPH